jgi:hypothetical protein
MRRLCRWLSGLRWKEWWPVSVAGEGRRKVAEEKGSAALSLYEVFRRLLVMEMEVFKLVAMMLAAERRGGEREAGSAGSRNRVREAGFFVVFGPTFLPR